MVDQSSKPGRAVSGLFAFGGVAVRRPITDEKFYVYVHSRRSNGEPFYVGKGNGDRACRRSNRSAHWKAVVAKADGFYTTMLAENLSEEFSLLLEREAIDKYRRLGVTLINKTDGGDGISGLVHTPETRAKMSRSKTGVPMSPRTPEQKAAMSIAVTGYKHSAATRAKMSAAKKGRPSNRKGCVLTDEHKRRLSESKRGRTRAKAPI